MKVDKEFKTKVAINLLNQDPLLNQAYKEVKQAICKSVWPEGATTFTINNSEKKSNGVVPIKELCYIHLEEFLKWFREKPLKVLAEEKGKGGPIDVYKEFSSANGLIVKRVGLEFETGNISSAHRSLNKLKLGLDRKEIDLAIILLPVHELGKYLTDRISTYEELAPYFELTEGMAFIVIGFNADAFDNTVEIIKKGKDGMSDRSIKTWKDFH